LAKYVFLSTKYAFFNNRNQILTRINNKAKVCQLTRLIILGKAKVISFKDIEIARVVRAIKNTKGKGKRS
jgi:hypothetical protein